MLRRSVVSAHYASVRFGATLTLAGLIPSTGTVGDVFDNTLTKTPIGLYKTEAVRDDSPFRRGPLRRLADVELLIADWVHWYNTERPMHRPAASQRSNSRSSTTLQTRPNQRPHSHGVHRTRVHIYRRRTGRRCRRQTPGSVARWSWWGATARARFG